MRGNRRSNEDQPATPGIVKFRMIGSQSDLTRAARVMDELIRPGVEVMEVSHPYQNHREPGYRVYVTLRLDPDPRFWPPLPRELYQPRREIPDGE
jgi:hypothetical protein